MIENNEDFEDELVFSPGTNKAAKELVTSLLNPDKSRRLIDSVAIKKHHWFQSIVWEDILTKKLRNPSPLYHNL
jgi:hypothetical protein